MTIKEQLDKLKSEVKPPTSIKEYFFNNYDAMNATIRYIRKLNNNVESKEINELGYAKIAEMAFEDGIKSSLNKQITIKQVAYFLHVVHQERKLLKNKVSQVNSVDAPKTNPKQEAKVVEQKPIWEMPPVGKDEFKALTKAVIGWDRAKFLEVSNTYFYEHPSYWKFGLELQYVIAWLKEDAPGLESGNKEDRLKVGAGWSYGEFWDEYNKAKALRDLKIKKVG